MTLETFDAETPHELRVDVGAHGHLAATWYPTVHADAGVGRPVLVCIPGGTYTRRYFDLEVPGQAGYSFARHAIARGFPVVSFDVLGTGASARPERDVDLRDQADALADAIAQLPDIVDHRGPFVAVGHSMGGYVAMLQQAAAHSYAALAILGTTNQPIAPLEPPVEMIAAAATPEGRIAMAEQILASILDL